MKKPSLLARLRNWTEYHHTVSVVMVGMLLIATTAIGVGAYVYLQPVPTSTSTTVTQSQPNLNVTTPTATKYYSPLTGIEVPDEATTKRAVTGIMIENSQTARPQSGIKPAGIIYEAIAEGGITRFLTLHQEDRPSLIGPVRSVRPYYLDWLAPFQASVAHVGGSKNALKTVRNGSFRDIDQFFNGSYYYRAKDRPAPHNVYTSFDRLDALNQKKGYTTSSFTPFLRKLDSPVATPNAKSIKVSISGALYDSSYVYDATNNYYLRSEGGAAHKDREAGQVTPRVVIVIKVPTQIGFEDGYREQMTTSGSNKAYIFQDGTVIQGFWRKADQKSQIEFYDHAARRIALNAGQTWITVIAPGKTVTWQ